MTMEQGASGTARGRGWFMALICLGVFVVYMDATIVNVALPEMQMKLAVGLNSLQWVVDGYTLTFACLLLMAGTVGDIIGHKRVFAIGMIGFTAFSACCALANSIDELVTFRFLQGAFGALMIPASLAMIRNLYEDPAARAKAIGIWAGLGGLALAVGPLAGGWLVEGAGWKSIFWINVPIGIVVFAILLAVKRETVRNRDRSLDVPGQALFILAVGALTYALIEGHSLGWGSARIMGSFIAAGVLLAAFLLRESLAREPLLPLGLFRNPVFTAACFVNFFGFFGLYAIVFLMTLYFQNVEGWSPTGAGVRFLSLNVSIMIASFAWSSIAARVSPTVLIPAGMLAMGGSLMALTAVEPGSAYADYAWALAGIGIGVSFAGSSATVALMASVPLHRAGTASGVANTFRQLSAVFGVALSGTLVSARLPDSSSASLLSIGGGDAATRFADGMHDAFLLSAAGCFFAAVAAVGLLAAVARRRTVAPNG
ncbi:MFS transporter [Cohnella zeiphila]|uniref:MFS transporter n=1 Tax=Cohnella zeiphila TaxID=2761120 RepID=A0A7X0ST54_9BACL|nr:MFS transporter [Cohnella zeiphila]MBB6735635.1 MFS transporter [Cohnella zeiphila]